MSLSREGREVRWCECRKTTLEIERAWLDAEESAGAPFEDTTEILRLEDGTLLLLWPEPDGWYRGRKLDPERLRLTAEERCDGPEPTGAPDAS